MAKAVVSSLLGSCVWTIAVQTHADLLAGCPRAQGCVQRWNVSVQRDLDVCVRSPMALTLTLFSPAALHPRFPLSGVSQRTAHNTHGAKPNDSAGRIALKRARVSALRLSCSCVPGSPAQLSNSPERTTHRIANQRDELSGAQQSVRMRECAKKIAQRRIFRQACI